MLPPLPLADTSRGALSPPHASTPPPLARSPSLGMDWRGHSRAAFPALPTRGDAPRALKAARELPWRGELPGEDPGSCTPSSRRPSGRRRAELARSCRGRAAATESRARPERAGVPPGIPFNGSLCWGTRLELDRAELLPPAGRGARRARVTRRTDRPGPKGSKINTASTHVLREGGGESERRAQISSRSGESP